MAGPPRRGLAGLTVGLVEVVVVLVGIVVLAVVVVVVINIVVGVVVIMVVAVRIMVVAIKFVVVDIIGVAVVVVTRVVVVEVGLGWRGGTADSACLIGRRRRRCRRDHRLLQPWIHLFLLRRLPPSLSAKWRLRWHLLLG